MSIRYLVLLMILFLLIPAFPVASLPPTITYTPPPWYIIASIMKSLPASADATLNSFIPLNNFGSEPELSVGRRKISTNVVTYTINWDSVVNFDVYSLIPPGSEVQAATLTLTVKQPPDTGVDVQVYPLTKSFSESTVTWSSHANSYGPLITTKHISFDAHDGTKINFDVTAYVKGKIGTGSPIHGFLLKVPSNTDDGVSFYSREGAPYDSWKPTLVITYKEPYIDLVASQTSLNLKQGDKAYVQLAIGGTFLGDAELSHKWVGPTPGGITLTYSKTSGKVPFASTLEIDASDSTTPGEYKLEVKAKNKEGNYNIYDKVNITIQVTSAQEPDFSLSVSPQSVTVTQGQVAEYSVAVTPVAGFSGTVQFTASGIPPGSTYQFVSSGSTIYLRITTSVSTPPGDYTITVTAEGGGKTHTATVSLTVTPASTSSSTAATTTTTTTTQGFFIRVDPSAVTLPRGGAAYLTVRVQGIGGFSSPVTLSASGLPQGVTISSNVNNAPPDFTANLTLVATNSAPMGTHQFTLMASGGGITRTSTVTLTVTGQNQTQSQTQAQTQTGTQTGTGTAAQGFDFSISVTPTTLVLNPSSTGSVAVTVRRIRGSGTVMLSASGLPPDVRVTFSPPALQEGTSSLVIQAGQTTGTFTVVVTGTSGRLKRSATFQLQVRAEESRCIIATAAFGSELAPEVSYLREFRDGTVMATYSGSRFLTVFNAFYYSWSPGLATVIRGSPLLASVTRSIITPLIYALKVGSTIYSFLPRGDLSMMVVGSLVSLILGLVYLWPLSLLSLKFRRLSDPKYLRVASVIAAGSAILLGFSAVALIDPLAMVFASTLVLSCLLIPPLALSRLMASRATSSPSH
ncbi:MAG: DNRLRE domain-containing protein [Candidatus Korarchaeota archaeon]|nr:DNRLRE domain-containing protein [Candidatus Korarchaeota archaeon]